jgi:hypothetical protein
MHLLAICKIANYCFVIFCTILVKPNLFTVSQLNRIYFLIIVFICFTAFNCKSQNLINNGSFESYTNPLNCYGGFDNYNATPIYHVLDNWYGYYTPDYFHDTCTNGPLPNQYGFDIPANLFGYSNTKNGNAYIGLTFYQKSDESKEYVYQQLSTPLQAGKMYCLSFYVSRSYRSTYAIKNIEVLFSNTLINLSNGYIQANPQIIKQTNFVVDTTIWSEIQGCFTANGGEQYLMIGNFNSNANTDTLFIGTTNPIPFYGDFSYYYIDDIKLIDQSNVGIRSIESNNNFEIYPNPNTGLLKFNDLRYCKGDYNVKILDLFGKEIINEVLKEELDISSFDKGVYTLLLYKNKQLVVTKKVMKN